jgi:hypothetical protein
VPHTVSLRLITETNRSAVATLAAAHPPGAHRSRSPTGAGDSHVRVHHRSRGNVNVRVVKLSVGTVIDTSWEFSHVIAIVITVIEVTTSITAIVIIIVIIRNAICVKVSVGITNPITVTVVVQVVASAIIVVSSTIIVIISVT